MVTATQTEVIEPGQGDKTILHTIGGHSLPPPPLPRVAASGEDDAKRMRSTSLSARDSAAQGLVQMFGLDPRVAVFLVIVDLLLFGGNIVSLGTLIPLGVAVGAAVGFITYRGQRHWFGDDHESALIKAMMVAVLTAIPVPITPLVAIPGGVLGVVKAIRRK
jgi:hypothetical protein